MLEGLELTGSGRALEVGTGYGYQTALLAQLCEQVFSVDVFPDFVQQARANLDTAGIRNVEVFVGDGSLGLPHGAPYEAVVVAAAAPARACSRSRAARDGTSATSKT